MQRLLFILVLLLAAPALAGPASDARQGEAQRQAMKQLLESPAGRELQLRYAPRRGAVAFIHGSAPLAKAAAGDETQTAQRWLHENKRLFLNRGDLHLAGSSHDVRGGRHLRFRQTIDGVPLRGGEVLAHFNAAGEMYAVTAGTQAGVGDIDTQARLQIHEAEYIAMAQFSSADLRQQTVLELRRVDGAWRLVYAVTSMVDRANRWLTVVDAHTGDILDTHLDHRDGTASASGSDLAGAQRQFKAWRDGGLYYLIDVTLPLLAAQEDPFTDASGHGNTLVVDLMNSDGSDWRNITSARASGGWDAAGVSALVNSQAAHRYFLNTHGRAGIDGKHSGLLSAVHYKSEYDNAYWNGEWVIYGDGGQRFTSFARCLDMVVHETTHGVIDHTANLLYENQSGALNESFADVFGVLATGDNWTLGEGCVKVQPGFLRSLAAPQGGLRRQPDHMDDYVHRPNTKEGDWGAVHANSGIPNRAAYLLMEGLSREGLGTSIGRDKAGKLYYHALTHYLVADAQFIDLRRAMLLAAEALFPGSGAERDAVAAAFDTVGIVEGMDGADDAAGELGASTSRIDFGDVSGDSARRELLLTNTGTADIVIYEFRLDNAAFAHDFTNQRLAPGATLRGTVSFTSDGVAGSRLATLEIVTDASGAPLTIDLTATVPASKPAANITPPAAAAGGGAFGPLLLLCLAAARRRAMFPVKVSPSPRPQGDDDAPRCETGAARRTACRLSAGSRR